MQRYRVILPEHVKAGDKIRIQCPDGTEAELRVPAGLKGGDSFFFDKRGFLDREIVTLQDCCLAVGVGLLIGCAIVLGFLWGVLAVTDPDQPPHEPHPTHNLMTTSSVSNNNHGGRISNNFHSFDAARGTKTIIDDENPATSPCNHLLGVDQYVCLQRNRKGGIKNIHVNKQKFSPKQPAGEEKEIQSGQYFYGQEVRAEL